MKRLLLTTVMALALAGTTQALTITSTNGVSYSTTNSTDSLSLTPGIPAGNEPQNAPAIIGGSNQPQQPALFGFNDYTQNGHTGSFTEFSSATVGAKLGQNVAGTGYDLSAAGPLAAFLLASNALTFDIGIDVNTAGHEEVLETFAIINLTDRTIISLFQNVNGSGAMPTANNGSGFPDYTLTGFNLTLADFQPGDTLLFFAQWSGATDGAEQFFLVPSVQVAVPGPIVASGLPGMAAAFGLIGLNWYRRRRSNALPA